MHMKFTADRFCSARRSAMSSLRAFPRHVSDSSTSMPIHAPRIASRHASANWVATSTGLNIPTCLGTASSVPTRCPSKAPAPSATAGTLLPSPSLLGSWGLSRPSLPYSSSATTSTLQNSWSSPQPPLPRQPALPPAAPPSVGATVRFMVHEDDHSAPAPGSALVVVGSIAALGSWDLQKAVRLKHEGNHWVAAVQLAEYHGALEYKLAVVDGSREEWEPGSNRLIVIEGGSCSLNGPIEAPCSWGACSGRRQLHHGSSFVSDEEDMGECLLKWIAPVATPSDQGQRELEERERDEAEHEERLVQREEEEEEAARCCCSGTSSSSGAYGRGGGGRLRGYRRSSPYLMERLAARAELAALLGVESDDNDDDDDWGCDQFGRPRGLWLHQSSERLTAM